VPLNFSKVLIGHPNYLNSNLFIEFYYILNNIPVLLIKLVLVIGILSLLLLLSPSIIFRY
jgi:hypothetical protein